MAPTSPDLVHADRHRSSLEHSCKDDSRPGYGDSGAQGSNPLVDDAAEPRVAFHSHQPRPRRAGRRMVQSAMREKLESLPGGWRLVFLTCWVSG